MDGRNARNKSKHDNYELDDIEDTMIFSPTSVDDKIASVDSTSCCRHSKGATN